MQSYSQCQVSRYLQHVMRASASQSRKGQSCRRARAFSLERPRRSGGRTHTHAHIHAHARTHARTHAQAHTQLRDRTARMSAGAGTHARAHAPSYMLIYLLAKTRSVSRLPLSPRTRLRDRR
eukprot:3930229-Pleurochrysis_carterae.AAC.1